MKKSENRFWCGAYLPVAAGHIPEGKSERLSR